MRFSWYSVHSILKGNSCVIPIVIYSSFIFSLQTVTSTKLNLKGYIWRRPPFPLRFFCLRADWIFRIVISFASWVKQLKYRVNLDLIRFLHLGIIISLYRSPSIWVLVDFVQVLPNDWCAIFSPHCKQTSAEFNYSCLILD